MGANHNGSLAIARNYVYSCKEAGAHVVKFQTYSADTLYSKNTERIDKFENPYNIIKKNEMPRSWLKELKDYSDEVGIEFMSTPFDFEAVEELVEIGVKRLKISSFEATDKRFVSYAAQMQLPLIISTGLCSLNEILEIYDWVRAVSDKELVFLHCMSSYPTKKTDMNTDAIEKIYDFLDDRRNIYKVHKHGGPWTEVGLSDHSIGIESSIYAAVMNEPVIIEKHVTFGRSVAGPDHGHALEMSDLRKMVSLINCLEFPEIGKNEKTWPFLENDKRNMEVEGDMWKARRSIVASANIKKGESLTWDNVTTKRPGIGIPAKLIEVTVGKIALQDIEKDEIISEELVNG